MEEKKNRQELELLIGDILSSYSDLIRTDNAAIYSKKITKAMHYIQEHLYLAPDFFLRPAPNPI